MKINKKELQLLMLAAVVGFLGNYTASYIFSIFQKVNDASIHNTIGSMVSILFVILIFLIIRISKK
ncbi:hypothetical protein J4206_00655 [Candidatus Woesearchaeota archaeon]|nr:hypothetical protein [Candidatus Woesearchaeota archaeon]